MKTDDTKQPEPQEPEWDDDDENWDDGEGDELDEAMDNCGQISGRDGGGCMYVGTEYCDWDCPFSAAMWREASRNRDSKGRFCKSTSSNDNVLNPER